MKIALVAPSPIPYTIGGAEKLWSGLFNFINYKTSHQCEIIKVPIKEDNFWNLIDAYYKFYNLDLSHFDMVISGKYPAWMIKHPNHHLYMLHPLRGLYDLYDKSFDKQESIDLIKKDTTIDELFEKLFELKEKGLKVDFPSKTAKDVIKFLDKKAFENIISFKAISKTITVREDYFPSNAKIDIIYPPTTLKNLSSKSYDYFFIVSRLDKPKRVDLAIKAYIKSKSDIPLKIAGVGKELEYLKDIAKDNPNIEFLGFLSDEELSEFYSMAFAVIFIPKEEDYGIVTIEAMQSKKCVITCSDSGGVLEFVKDKQTGLISKPTIEDLSLAISYLSQNRYDAIKFGENAYKLTKDISWQNSIQKLLSVPKKLLVVSTYPIYPPMGGGQNRIYYLYKYLSEYFDITVLSLVHSSLNYTKNIFSSTYREIQIPKTSKHQESEEALEKIVEASITDIFMLENYEMARDYIKEFVKLQKDVDYIIASHPYLYPMIQKYTNKPVIYDSHNVEFLLKKEILKDNLISKKLLEILYQTEKDCYLNSYIITTCSNNDKEKFIQLFGNREMIFLLPNGTDIESIEFISKKRRELRKKYFKVDKKIAIFIGSAHKPNIDAVKEILKLAKTHKDIEFVIIGGVQEAFINKKIPPNVIFKGMVDDEQKNHYLSIADIALNPMLKGSGTNLKILEYMASGIPVLTTPVGARGLDIEAGLIAIDEIAKWHLYLENIEYFTDTKGARDFVEKRFDWKEIAKNFYEVIRGIS